MKEFFSETGNLSMTRLITFILVIAVCIVIFAMVHLTYQGKSTGDLFTLVSFVLGFAIAGKVWQRKIENENPEEMK